MVSSLKNMLNLRVTFLRSLKEKSIGLIGAREPYPIYFTTRWGIHTFGLKFPIDVLILDKKRRIARVNQNLKPNQFYFWLPIYKDVIELPAGEIIKKKIKIDDTVTLHLSDD